MMHNNHIHDANIYYTEERQKATTHNLIVLPNLEQNTQIEVTDLSVHVNSYLCPNMGKFSCS